MMGARWYFSLIFVGFALLAHAAECGSCHPREAKAYAQSAMARSWSRPDVPASGTLEHPKSGSKLTIWTDSDGMHHRLDEQGQTANYTIAYQIGANRFGSSFLIRIQDFLFQSPASWYSSRQAWDLTPGYETEHGLDFDHPITSGCLFCHTGSLRLLGSSDDRFADPPFTAISCERCHGDGESHREHPSRQNIVNPKRLEPRARDSVCEQCHLEGEARILNPSRDWWDFNPGMRWEEVAATYVDHAAPGLKAVSHSEQLAASRCSVGSQRQLWCGTCHNPHGEISQTDVCRSCHGTLPTAHVQNPPQCVSCHMPKREATNVAHTAVTDHTIPRLPRRLVDAAPSRSPELVAWREPDTELLRKRDLGLAKLASGDPKEIEQGYRILGGVSRDGDAAVLTGLGSVLLQQRHAKLAVQFFEQAAALHPRIGSYALYLGVALREAGQIGRAVNELQRAIELNPSLARAYRELADTYRLLGQEQQAHQTMERFRRFMPQTLSDR